MKKRVLTFTLSILFLFLTLNAFKYIGDNENYNQFNLYTKKAKTSTENTRFQNSRMQNDENENSFTRVYSFSCPVWTSTTRITWNSGLSQYPRAKINISDHIHLVWHDSSPGNKEIYFRKSTNKGTTWSALERLTWTAGESSYPDIAIDSNSDIHVSYNDDSKGNNDIYYKYSYDGGFTWTSPQQVSWNTGESWYPQIAVDSSNNVHIVWYDNSPGNYELYHRRSWNYGISWSTLNRLTWTTDGNSYNPSFCIDNADNLHVVFEDNTGGNYEIYYKKSTDSGTTWVKKRLTWTNPGTSRIANISCDTSNNLYVVYQDTPSGNSEIYFKKSTDSGNSWSAPERLSWTSGDSSNPVIDAKIVPIFTYLNVVWRDNSSGNYEIYHKNSSDGGTNWTLNRITWNSGSSEKPLTIFNSGSIHIIWQDATPGNYEIYHKRGD